MMKAKMLQTPLLITGAILCIPLIAMQFTNEVQWNLADFGIAGVLLFGVTLGIRLIGSRLKNRKYRAILITIVLALFLLLWVELAVGIFGSPLAGS